MEEPGGHHLVEGVVAHQQGDLAVPDLVADLEGVTFLDSSGINVFIFAHRQAAGARDGCVSPPLRMPSCTS